MLFCMTSRTSTGERFCVKAMADYEAVGRAVEKKTARLKALRLAKEEAARQAAAAKKTGPPR